MLVEGNLINSLTDSLFFKLPYHLPYPLLRTLNVASNFFSDNQIRFASSMQLA